MTTSNEASVRCFGPGSVGGAPGDFAADLLVFEAGAPRGRTLRLHALDGTVLVGQLELPEPVSHAEPVVRRGLGASHPASSAGLWPAPPLISQRWMRIRRCLLTGGLATRVGP
jgi:hypothetical protein